MKAAGKFDAERWKFVRDKKKNPVLLLFDQVQCIRCNEVKQQTFFRGCNIDEHLTSAGALCDVGICLCACVFVALCAFGYKLSLSLSTGFYQYTSQI